MIDVVGIMSPLLLATIPFVARYRGGIRALILTTVLLGAALVSNELWHWLTPPTFYGVAPWAWCATAIVITVVYLPHPVRRSLRLVQLAGSLAAAVFVPSLGFWIS